MNLNILRALLFALLPDNTWGLPGLLWGEPGTGKTTFLRQVARTFQMHCERLSPAERGEGQFGVVPVPGEDGYLHYPAPKWASDLAHGGLIFLDEINLAPPALQAPMLGLVQLRVLGEYRFPGTVRVLAAANEVRDAAGGWDLAPALCNRFGHFDYEGMDAEEWAAGLLGHFDAESTAVTPMQTMQDRVLAEWPTKDAEARGVIAGFITRRSDLLHKRPVAGNTNTRAWPSRRSCEYAAIALASAKVQGLSVQDTDVLLSAFVGFPWVSEFRTWEASIDLPNPGDLLDGKVKFEHSELRLDTTLVVLGSCTALVLPEKATRRRDRVQALWQLLDTLGKSAPEVVMPAARQLIKHKLLGKEYGSLEALRHLHPVLKAAGFSV